jgi:hypothetical protein
MKEFIEELVLRVLVVAIILGCAFIGSLMSHLLICA